MKIARYGRGGCGREVAPLAREMGALVRFVSDDPADHGPDCGPLEDLPADYRICIAIADGAARRRVAERCEAAGREFVSVAASTSRRRGQSFLGEGAVLCDHTLVTDNVRVGRHLHLNTLTYIGHDCVVGDFVTFGPRTGLNGNTIVEDGVYIGTGAILRQGAPDRPLRIGRGAFIAMGAVVTRDVPPGAFVAGSPARAVRRASGPGLDAALRTPGREGEGAT